MQAFFSKGRTFFLEVEQEVVFRFSPQPAYRPGSILALRPEALPERGEHLIDEGLAADHRAVAEVADLAAQVVGLRQLSATRQHLQRLLPRDPVAVNGGHFALRGFFLLPDLVLRDAEKMAAPAAEGFLGLHGGG